MIGFGKAVPRFELPLTNGKRLSNKSIKGKKVLFVFFCYCFSPVCTRELLDFKRRIGVFRRGGIQIVGVSTDSVWAQRAWAKILRIPFPLGSDHDAQVSKRFGIYNEAGYANRGFVFVDAKGVVRFSHMEASALERTASVEVFKKITRWG